MRVCTYLCGLPWAKFEGLDFERFIISGPLRARYDAREVFIIFTGAQRAVGSLRSYIRNELFRGIYCFKCERANVVREYALGMFRACFSCGWGGVKIFLRMLWLCDKVLKLIFKLKSLR